MTQPYFGESYSCLTGIAHKRDYPTLRSPIWPTPVSTQRDVSEVYCDCPRQLELEGNFMDHRSSRVKSEIISRPMKSE